MPPSAAPEAALLAAPARTLTVPGIRRRPVPHAVPPLVGEPGAVTSVFHHLSPDQGVLDLVLTDDGRRVPTAPTAPLPEIRAWSTRYVVVLQEVLEGRRPVQQLLRWSTPEIYVAVQRRAVLAARLRARRPRRPGARAPRVLTVHTCCPAERVVEVSAVVHDGEKVRAYALRVEGAPDRWRVSALELG